MQFSGKVGMLSLGAGVESPVRMAKNGSLVVTQGAGGWMEPVINGITMTACSPIAGVAPGTATSTTPPFALWNPPSSGKNLSIVKVALGYISGTLGAGSIMMGAIPMQVTVPTTGTEIIPTSNLIGAARGVARVFQGSTFVAAPTPLKPLFVMGAFVGGAVQPTPSEIVSDGLFVIPPGNGVALYGVGTAGTTPLVLLSMTWDELTIS